MEQERLLSRRWYVLLAILAIGGGALFWNLGVRQVVYHQERVLATAGIVLVGSLGLAIWTFFLSPWTWRVRGRILVGGAFLLAIAGLFVEFRGFSGDLEPVLGWRFRSGVVQDESRLATPAAKVLKDAAPIWANSPQFLGKERNATVRGVQLARDWYESPPEEVWRKPVGSGWSGFSVAGRRAVTQEQRGDKEAVVCRGALDGEVRWVHEVEASFESDIAGDGPRATPTIVGSRVYAAGATGVLACLELETGQEIWSVDVVATNGARIPEWGYSCSPWVSGGQVVVTPGVLSDIGLVAYDAATGASRWRGGDDKASYSSPTLHTIAGRRQLLALNANTLSACDPEDGHVLWRTDWNFPNPNVCQPMLLAGARVFVSSGYGAGCALFHVIKNEDESFSVEREWKTTSLKSKFSSYVHKSGYIYGLDDGMLTCINLASGARVWKAGRYGHGQVLLVGEQLLVTTEDGGLVLVAAGPEGFKELSRIEVLDGKAWNPPAFAAPLLFLRNDAEAVCYRLPLI